MSYLEDIRKQITLRDFHKFLILWEEYINADSVDTEEFILILKNLKDSDFAEQFGQIAETALPLWQTIDNGEDSYQVLKLLVDLQTTNSSKLADLSIETLQKKFGASSNFQDFLRMSGLRARSTFQGSISSFELLTHLKKGNFVYHSAGWGTGEVMDVSLLRETASIEFENVSGLKHITFSNAFKTLIPLDKGHFLSKRFSDADLFEESARKDPAECVKLLLRDLGPKTSLEIKEELQDLVIPEKDWNKWWSQAKSKLKKDTLVQTPDKPQEPYHLRKREVSHSQGLFQALQKTRNPATFLQTAYTFVRDIPQLLKEEESKKALETKLLELSKEQLTPEERLELFIFLDTFFLPQEPLKDFIKTLDNPKETIYRMNILAFKKRALVLIGEVRDDKEALFFEMLLTIEPSNLREYILEELNKKETREALKNKLRDLMVHPEQHPDFFFWYFQKLLKESEGLPFSDKEGLCLFLEHYLILLNRIELDPNFKELAKKMMQLLTAQRYKLIRDLIEGTEIEFLKEFLLLISKCHSLTANDKKNVQALAAVIQPSLTTKEKGENMNHVVWTTEEGYRKTKGRIEEISTKEMIENAKEVEKARSYGDLRENSEYKFAVEKRQRLQSEIRGLSQMLNHARIITKDDIDLQTVGVGSIVKIETPKREMITYTILGPWDSDSDRNIISLQSKMAQAMCGCKAGDSFTFREETYKVLEIGSFL